MRAALYARVSTNDRDQDPETQLLVLRDFARAQRWEVAGEYVDHAPANDPLHRTAWRKMLDDAAKRRFQAVLVFKLDRAFRSVKHMHETLAAWERVNVSFFSAREGFDTSTALGRLLMNLLASLAEFELEVLSERVKAGMDRARRQGKRIGRPAALRRAEVRQAWPEVAAALDAGTLSVRGAAKRLGVGPATIRRMRAAERAERGRDENGVPTDAPEAVS